MISCCRSKVNGAKSIYISLIINKAQKSCLLIFFFTFANRTELITLINNPYSINSVSFALTYGGTLGIIYFQPIINQILKTARADVLRNTLNDCGLNYRI